MGVLSRPAMMPLLLLLLASAIASPQRNSAQRNFDGHEFVELLPEDFTVEEYDLLLDDFYEFLNRKDLLSRGDFVDIGNLECTPKVKIPRSYLPLPSLACT